MNEKNRQDAELAAFVKEQIVGNARATRRTWLAGVGFVLFLAVYLSGVLWLVHGMLEPAIAARTIARNVEADMPGFMSEMENALRQEADPLAAEVCKAIVDAMPRARAEAEAQIDRAYLDHLPMLRDAVAATIREYAAAHQTELREAVSAHKEKDFARIFADHITQEVARDLDRELAAVQPGASLNYIHMAALDAIRDMNARLAALASKKSVELTRSERLQRRLIVSLAQAVDEASLARDIAARAAAAVTPLKAR